MTALLRAMARSLALTLALELPVACAFGLRRAHLGTAALAQVLTNPAVVALHAAARLLLPQGLAAITLALELAAVAAEWQVYARCTPVRRPLLLSLCANGLSYACGLALVRLTS